ncbi:MAG: tRNA-dihydrouridine synthase family protein [Methylotenera sp.]|nr:tRNA-dihydrouridine synthase family protein [Oligoflexia bacterium]
MSFLNPNQTTLVLAPMEGVMDAPMRALIADLGGFDYGVSEFVRVGQGVVTAQQILRDIPDLYGPVFGSAKLPLQLQLLGDSPELMAATAIEGCIAGARAIDINFGCPAPTILRRSGGAALLRTPCAITEIVSAVRTALPAVIPVSAKIRLGWEDPNEVDVIARAVEDGGANWITIHARTKQEGYRPGVHWDAVARVKARLSIPVVANGDLFTAEEVARCAAETGCTHFMIGRGILKNPFLAHDIRASQSLPALRADIPAQLSNRLRLGIERYAALTRDQAANSGFIPSRVKQWVGMVRDISDDVPRDVSREVLTAVKRARTTSELLDLIHRP